MKLPLREHRLLRVALAAVLLAARVATADEVEGPPIEVPLPEWTADPFLAEVYARNLAQPYDDPAPLCSAS